eukprot:5068011-Amphidinium_carterae.1
MRDLNYIVWLKRGAQLRVPTKPSTTRALRSTASKRSKMPTPRNASSFSKRVASPDSLSLLKTNPGDANQRNERDVKLHVSSDRARDAHFIDGAKRCNLSEKC